MEKLNIAFAGFRHSHIYGLYNLAKEYDSINICGAWEEHQESKKSAEDQGVEFTYNTYDDMLNDDSVDVIAIADYYSRRGELALQALKAGKHIISDKPLCTSYQEAEEIEKISKEKNLKIGVMLDLRDCPNVVCAKKLIDEGKIGKINNISFGGQHPLNYGTRSE